MIQINGSIVFSFTALNGELITNEFECVNDSDYSFSNSTHNLYFITDKIQECNKEKERYPIKLGLENGEAIGYNDIKDDGKIKTYSFVQDENGNVSFEVIKESKDDVQIAMLNWMKNIVDSLKNMNKEYNIKWDENYKVFSVYYDESIEEKIIAKEMKLGMLWCSMVAQVLDGEADWHLTINYYDYNTGELLNAEIIR